MSFNITLYQSGAEKNRVDKSEFLTSIAEYTGELKSETSIIDPEILIECDLEDVALSNYMYIPEFGRYYFITNITSVRSSLVQFEAHCDVLMSFKDEILANSAIIKRNEGAYDLYLQDPKIKELSRPRFQQLYFEDGYEPDVDDISFILAVV